MSNEPRVEDLLRGATPQVLATLVRRRGRFDLCEDAVQEALLAAATQWTDATPDNPVAWLVTVADRRFIDLERTDRARRGREDKVVAMDARTGAAVDQSDTLTLLFLCCHPELSEPSQMALTLRAVGGLSTAEIARAFLVPEATMAQRISRAKQRIVQSGARFEPPDEDQRNARLGVVLHVLYLMFNEGYSASSGVEVVRVDLTTEAIRLTRLLHRLVADDGEVIGLLALMLLTDARRSARTRADGSLVPLSDQDRGAWDRGRIAEGVDLVSQSLARHRLGPYQLQAAIAAVHAEAPCVDDTDWPQILALYDLLQRVAPSPVVALNRAVAVAEVHGARAGLDLLADLHADPRMAAHHRLHSTRAHLFEQIGDHASAYDSYRTAAAHATNVPEKRYLEQRAAAIRGSSDPLAGGRAGLPSDG